MHQGWGIHWSEVRRVNSRQAKEIEGIGERGWLCARCHFKYGRNAQGSAVIALLQIEGTGCSDWEAQTWATGSPPGPAANRWD